MIFFSKEHEWVRVNEEKEVATIGVTNHAQEALGDIVYLELPEPGRKLSKEEVFGVVESVKAVSDLFSPVSGEVIEVHEALTQSPDQINQSPENSAWMIRVRMNNPAELDTLLNQEAYEKFLAEEVK